MLASSFEAISTLIRSNLKLTIFQSNQLRFILFSTLHCSTGSSSSGHYQLILPFGQYQRSNPHLHRRRNRRQDCILQRGKIVALKSIRTLPIQSSTNSTPRYIRRQKSKPPKSSFKALLIVTSLLRKAKQMSLSKQVPEDLKSHDVERGNGNFRPPIPYVPEKLDELDPDRKVPTIKIELSNGVESRQPVWDGHGNSENFLCHMQGMREAMEDMGLFEKYEEAKMKVSKAKEMMQDDKNLREVVLEQIENTVLETDKRRGTARQSRSTRQRLLRPKWR
jgi:hypothetical protein